MSDTTQASITIYACPRRYVADILGELAGEHWSHDWEEWPNAAVYDELRLGEAWTNHLASIVAVDSWSSFLAERDCQFAVSQDPKYEWDGEQAIGDPRLGVWTATGADEAAVPIRNIDALIESIDDPPEDYEQALDDLIARLAGLTGRLHRRALTLWEQNASNLPTLYPIEPEDLECERCGNSVAWAENEDVLVCHDCAFRADPPEKMPEEATT